MGGAGFVPDGPFAVDKRKTASLLVHENLLSCMRTCFRALKLPALPDACSCSTDWLCVCKILMQGRASELWNSAMRSRSSWSVRSNTCRLRTRSRCDEGAHALASFPSLVPDCSAPRRLSDLAPHAGLPQHSHSIEKQVMGL